MYKAQPIILAQKIHEQMKMNKTFVIPISIIDFAKSINMNVVEYPFHDLDGFVFVYNGNCNLFYNMNKIDVRSRFTIAHEIGHWLLGHPDGFKNSNKILDRQADRFAEEILMPAEQFKLSFKYYLKGTTDYLKPHRLARKFWVSRQAARLRIERLGLN